MGSSIEGRTKDQTITDPTSKTTEGVEAARFPELIKDKPSIREPGMDDYEGFVTREDWIAALRAKQARIDELMMEYCPDEMSEAQLDEWARHQVAVPPEECARIKAALSSSSESKG